MNISQPEPNSSMYFNVIDYSIFSALLGSSVLIGLYAAYCGKRKQDSTDEYVLGSKEIGVFPIVMSLIATHYSGVGTIGVPAEIYVYGSQYCIGFFMPMFVVATIAILIMPVFYSLNETSMYEYLNKRFGPSVRTLGSAIFVCKMTLIIPVTVYGPTLALAQVSGYSINVLMPVICVICTIYTTIGGFKAVVWTDNLQLTIMAVVAIALAIIGTYHVGGPAALIDISDRGERLDMFNMNVDPTERHNFLNIAFGKFFYLLAYFSVNQGTIQRCLALPTLKKAQMLLFLFGAGFSVLQHLSFYTGLVIYASFHDCDPITTQKVRKADQLLPYFVMKVTSHIPALPGIFLSAIFSATLSTMSTGLNSISTVIFKDFIKPLKKNPTSEKRAAFYMKIITIICGVVCTLLAFTIDHLSGVLQTASSLGGTTVGTLLGLFCLGMFCPWANTKGALTGGITAASLVGWMAFGQQKAIYEKKIVYPKKPISIAGCDNITVTHIAQQNIHVFNATISTSREAPFILYAISYVWYTLIGVVTVVVVGMLVSCLTGPNDPQHMDPNLFSPPIRKFILARNNREERTHSAAKKQPEQARPLMEISYKNNNKISK